MKYSLFFKIFIEIQMIDYQFFPVRNVYECLWGGGLRDLN